MIDILPESDVFKWLQFSKLPFLIVTAFTFIDSIRERSNELVSKVSVQSGITTTRAEQS